MTTQEIFLYTAAFHAGVAALLGLIPLILGIVKKQAKVGITAIFAGVIGGALLGLILSIPITILFISIIFGRSRKRGTPN